MGLLNYYSLSLPSHWVAGGAGEDYLLSTKLLLITLRSYDSNQRDSRTVTQLALLITSFGGYRQLLLPEQG